MQASVVPEPARAKGLPVYFKLLILVVIVALLGIPLIVVSGLIGERKQRQAEVARQVYMAWGEQQTIAAAPVLVVPYTYQSATGPRAGVLHHLAARIDTKIALDPEIRRIGIFSVPVYRARVETTGEFPPVDVRRLGLEAAQIHWDRAVMALDVSHVDRLTEEPTVATAGATFAFAPTRDASVASAGLAAQTPLPAAGIASEGLKFALKFSIKGSRAVTLLPLARAAAYSVTSTWPHPGFAGKYLPDTRNISAAGFTANWQLPQWRAGFQQSVAFADDAGSSAAYRQAAGDAVIVRLMLPADHYAQIERAVKYGMMFVVILIATVFLIDVASHGRLHVVQYGLVGSALCLFFLLLLALAEVMLFPLAYALASFMSALLIVVYLAKSLGSWARAGAVGAVLGGVYGFLYVVLQLEDFALLIGALSLFLVLAVVMFATRNLDWSTLRPKPAPG
ncbi:MAG: cell envelope integrity protein CreD [Alphaproteobacteria bacterium]